MQKKGNPLHPLKLILLELFSVFDLFFLHSLRPGFFSYTILLIEGEGFRSTTTSTTTTQAPSTTATTTTPVATTKSKEVTGKCLYKMSTVSWIGNNLEQKWSWTTRVVCAAKRNELRLETRFLTQVEMYAWNLMKHGWIYIRLPLLSFIVDF